MINNKIKVYARIKPSTEPRRHLCEVKINKLDKKKILLLYKDFEKSPNSLTAKLHEYEEFVFENIFPETATQEIIYNSMAKPVVERAIEGFNATIMAYGQTGTGKTHTICGGQDISMKGIIPRAFKHVFIRMKEMKHVTFKVYLSAMEIYNDHAFDLLSDKFTKFGLPRMNSKQIIPRNLKMVQVSNMHDINKLLKKSSNNRVIRNTTMNDVSSRSHCIFSLHLYQHQPNNASITKSKIHMIDLSGSEKIGKKRPSGILFNESKHINLSLHYIELVIRALSDKNQDYIPYRNSMITSFLRDSLGGNSNTVMIFTLSLDPMFFEETILTCRFAQRVSLISNKILKIHKTYSTDHKKGNKTSKHKGITCNLDSSPSSSSDPVRDDRNEVLASLMEELKTTKSVNTQLSDRLLKVESEKNQLLKVQSDYNQLLQTLNTNDSFQSQSVQLTSSTIENLLDEIPSKDCNSQGMLKSRNKKNAFKGAERPYTVETSEVKVCAYCGKKIRKSEEDRTPSVDNCSGSCRKNEKIYNTSQFEKHHSSVKMVNEKMLSRNSSLKSHIDKCIVMNNLWTSQTHSFGKQEKETSKIILDRSDLETSFDFKHSELKNGEYDHLILPKDAAGSVPVIYYIYELIGLSLPSKNIITGKPYDVQEIQMYCHFLHRYLNIAIFKREFYEKHNDLAEKEFLGCHKLNKNIYSLEKLKRKLNELHSLPENGTMGRKLLEKQIKAGEKKIHHGKGMLEIIRAQRMELLKYVKKIRTQLIQEFHDKCFQQAYTTEAQSGIDENTTKTDEESKFHRFNAKSFRTIMKESGDQRTVGIEELKSYVFKQSNNFPINSISFSPKIMSKLKTESRFEKTKLKLISRSDTMVSALKIPIKIRSMVSDEYLLPSLKRINDRTKIISSEESYFSYMSEMNSVDPSSGISSLSEGISLDQARSNCF